MRGKEVRDLLAEGHRGAALLLYGRMFDLYRNDIYALRVLSEGENNVNTKFTLIIKGG